MPTLKNFDLGYCPKSYWGPQDLKTHFGSRIKGEIRRSLAMNQLEGAMQDRMPLQSALDEEDRSTAGAFHPWFMGGEYLPDFLPNEIEIARVTLKSTTMDVCSIRARRNKNRIIYRIVDEYMEEGSDRFSIKPKTSSRPLSMEQVIRLIDGNDLIDGPREGNYEAGAYCSPDEIFDFATVSSAFYPELDRWFDEANEEWRQKELAKLEDE